MKKGAEEEKKETEGTRRAVATQGKEKEMEGEGVEERGRVGGLGRGREGTE